jgi:putative flippase GtrA
MLTERAHARRRRDAIGAQNYGLMKKLKMMARCAGASLAAVAVEFGILSALVSHFHLYYLAASLIASVAGLVIAFMVNRHWAFAAGAGAAGPQLVRHSIVVAGGLAIGLMLMWLQVYGLGLPYQVSWLVGGSIVFFVWTFPMQRWFTFRAALAPATA